LAGALISSCYVRAELQERLRRRATLTNSQQKTLKLTIEAAFRRCRVGAGLGACGAKSKLAGTDLTSSPQNELTEANDLKSAPAL
jgi:hypothetical protein